jgi:hypothetical protein
MGQFLFLILFRIYFITQNLLFGSVVFIQNYYYNKAESGSVCKLCGI